MTRWLWCESSWGCLWEEFMIGTGTCLFQKGLIWPHQLLFILYSPGSICWDVSLSLMTITAKAKTSVFEKPSWHNRDHCWNRTHRSSLDCSPLPVNISILILMAFKLFNVCLQQSPVQASVRHSLLSGWAKHLQRPETPSAWVTQGLPSVVLEALCQLLTDTNF